LKAPMSSFHTPRETTSPYHQWEAPTSNPHLQAGKAKSQLTLTTSTPLLKKHVDKDGALPPPRAHTQGFCDPKHGVGLAPIVPHPLLEIYLGRCHITVDDNHMCEILAQHCIRHSSFFLRSTKEELIRIGLTLGAAQSLNQNPVELMRRAADAARDARRQN
jgi:hypothetical protein